MREVIPPRSQARRRDRHGRGIRGPVLPFSLPAWRTRADKFDDLIAEELSVYARFYPEQMARFDYGVLDVPDSDPAPWEARSPLARYIPFDRGSRLEGRIVFYRRLIERDAQRAPMPRLFYHDVVTDAVAAALGEHPEDIDWLG